MNNVNKVFTAVYDECTVELPFQKEWSNGKGYFSPAVESQCKPVLANGEVVKSITPGGRRLIFIGTRLGNICVYDRFTDQKVNEKNCEVAVFAFDCTTTFYKHDKDLDWTYNWASTEAIDDTKMISLVGNIATSVNIGLRLEHAEQ